MFGRFNILLSLATFSFGKVLEISSGDVPQTLKKTGFTLLKYYAPWCGHCKQLAPEFDKAAEELGAIATLAKIDATQDKEFASLQGVRGYPTLHWYAGEELIETYDGARSADALVAYVKEMIKDPITVSQEMPQIGTLPIFVYHGEVLPDLFKGLAKKNRKKMDFHHFNSGEDKVTIQHLDEDSHESFDVENLEEFFNAYKMPLVGILDGSTYSEYMSNPDKGLIWFLYPMEENTKIEDVRSQNYPVMKQIAEKFKDRYSVIYTDTAAFKQALVNILGASNYPAIAVNKYAGDKDRYLYEEGDMGAESIIKFIEDVENNNVKPFIRSEPIPESQPDSVKIVVANTMKEMVFSNEKDVLFEVYAPWCGHCKKLDPEYKKLGNKVVQQGLSDILTISKMDGTSNDSVVDSIAWQGFPTIFYVKAGSEEPTMYDGPRDAEGMWKWIQENHSKKDELLTRLESTDSSESDKEEL